MRALRWALVFALAVASSSALARKRRPTAAPNPISADVTFGTFRYQFSQTERIEIASGRTVVSVVGRGHTPMHGWFPLRVNVDNTGGPKQTLKLSFRSSSAQPIEIVKVLELDEGVSRAVTLSVPAEARYGVLEATSPVVGRQSASVGFSSVYDQNRLVLNFGTPDGFEAFVQDKPDNTSGEDQVVSMPLDEAPVELAAYLGTSAVVISDARGLEGLSEAQRSALEAWVALGGSLVLPAWPRAQGVLPLLRDGDSVRPYALGSISVPIGPSPLASVPVATTPVTPMSHADTVRTYGQRVDSLLPQALVPVGRFLLIITLFTLLIGPGSVWLARRRGPAILLASIPATAFATCVLILGSSLVLDGFTVHASTYGYTLLDSERHRATTVGLTAWYANLAPRAATFEATSALISPQRDGATPSLTLEWGDGAKVRSGFVPSRTYREWGHVAVTPTRARLVVKAKGDGFVVQNGLGHPITRLWVRVNDSLHTASSIADGAELALVPESPIDLSDFELVARDRFASNVLGEWLSAPLDEGQFLAKIEGQGFVPTGGVRLDLHAGEHLVRGEIAR